MGTVIIIILALLGFLILSGIVYLVLLLPTKYLVKTDKRKIVRLVLSSLTALAIMAYYLFVPASSNDDTASIEKVGDSYVLTLTGERVLMAHDLISALKSETYPDTFKIVIPRAQGIINGTELPTEKGHYGTLGTLNISDDNLIIDLYADNYDDKTKDPISWNGQYKLKWKKVD